MAENDEHSDHDENDDEIQRNVDESEGNNLQIGENQNESGHTSVKSSASKVKSNAHEDDGKENFQGKSTHELDGGNEKDIGGPDENGTVRDGTSDLRSVDKVTGQDAVQEIAGDEEGGLTETEREKRRELRRESVKSFASGEEEEEGATAVVPDEGEKDDNPQKQKKSRKPKKSREIKFDLFKEIDPNVLENISMSNIDKCLQGSTMNSIKQLVIGETRVPTNLAPLPDPDTFKETSSVNKCLLEFHLEKEKRSIVQSALREKAKEAHAELLSELAATEQTTPQIRTDEGALEILHQRVETVVPPTLLQTWVDNITALLNPRYKKTEAINNLFLEVRDEFDECMHDLTIRSLLKHEDEKEMPTKEWHLGLGRTRRYPLFLKRRKILDDTLFITHPIVRSILKLSGSMFPAKLSDFFKYREDLGIVELQKFKATIFNDLKREEGFIKQVWLPKIAGFFEPRKKPLACIPPKKLNSFFNCASNVLQIQVTELMRRTMDHFVLVMGDPTRIPMLKMDIYFDNGLQLLPSTSEVIETMKKVIESISHIGREFPSLESLANVRTKNEFIPINICEPYYEDILQTLSDKITAIYDPVMKHLASIDRIFGPLYSDELLVEVNEYLAGNHPFEEVREKMDFFNEFLLNISDMVANEYFTAARVSQGEIIRYLKECVKGFVDLIVNHLIEDHKKENLAICEEFEEIELRALKVPANTAELMANGEYMVEAATTKMEELKERITKQLYIATQLMSMSSLDDDHIELNSKTVKWLTDIIAIFNLNSTLYEKYKFEFEEVLRARIEELLRQLNDTKPELVVLNNMESMEKLPMYANIMRKFLKQFEYFSKEIEWINTEETLLKFGRSTYPALDELKSIIEPFAELVFLANKWRRTYAVWMDGTFEDLDGADMELQTEEFYKDIIRIQKQFKQRIKQMIADNTPFRFTGNMDDPDTSNHPAPLKLTDQVSKQIRDFRNNIRLVTILCNSALSKEHWDEIKNIFGEDITPDAGTTLRKMTKLGLEPYVEELEIVSNGATRSAQLFDSLKRMKEEWESITFTVNHYRDTTIPILGTLEDIQAVLDDQILKVLTMRGSAFVRPYAQEVKQFYELLTRVNETLEQWGKVQAGWMYLTPIFSSKDICAQMPEESQLFQELDQTYKRIMGMVQRDPRVLETAGEAGLLETLNGCVENLDKINDGVNAYLEQKRLFFPRFFFLSNDEMLEILSETKDPLRVQPHIKKCFEGIFKLGFDSDLNIHSFSSPEGENIDIISEIVTAEARGSVEKWLIQVEAQMILSIRDIIFSSWKAYPLSAREQWILEWPGQVVLCVSQIYWTGEVHNCLKSSEIRDLSEYQDSLVEQLNLVVSLVRGELNKLARITLSALIVIDVHAKDVVMDMAEKNVSKETDFYWLAQLRYYWDDDCLVRLINATVNYAYEYLGNTSRLVITPLTDRCYRTLIGAFQLHLNGAPEGPAGTGKTETTKDLAKALAVQCIVFNCSEGLDYIAMGKFFKGAASCGAWICFDEFNRIDLEVLSVIAQQILCIIVAVQAGLKTFVFEGTTLSLNPSCYICITMNPGYAGRTELPDNLKVLFRTVAMMVPDYAMIGEISLYSCGYVDARNLSVKIVSVYKLCSEQLSSQSHYDYGMRAVKTVLSAAGNLKLRYPNDSEMVLLLRSIVDVNLPKFLRHDVPLFNGIISDLFPGVTLPTPDYSLFIKSINEVCKKKVLQPVEGTIAKIIQIYEMMVVRHGFMVVGEPFAGKTVALHVLAEALALQNSWGEPVEPVDYATINPKSITMGQLYGQFDPVSYEWSDGIGALVFREFAMSTDERRKWIIYDGPVDAVWIENMNSVLDDNKKLCLTSGEVMTMTSYMSLIFEVMDLAQASPATVSRCGMIYFEPASIGWRPLMLSWLSRCNPIWREGYEDIIREVVDWMVDPCLEFIRKSCVQVATAGFSNTVKGFLQLFEMVMNDAMEHEEDFRKNTNLWFCAAFLVAGIWGLGGVLDSPSQEKFDDFFRNMWKQSDSSSLPELVSSMDVALPSEGTLFDYVYIYKQKGYWKSWPEIVKGMKAEETINLQQMLVPTVESAKYMHLFDMHIKYDIPFLWVGPTGTGKSFCLQNMLMEHIDQSENLAAFLTFTVQISANQTQELILSKLSKRRKGIYGPPEEMKRCVLFVDDFNLPVKEIYGAQPPLELLRQFFDHGHWYDTKDMTKIFLYKILIISAMGLPGGSRQEVYARSLRHFKLYSGNPLSEDSLARIFTNFLFVAYKRNGFAQDVMISIPPIVHATLDIFQTISQELRPTPAKSHYVFNVRDCDRVIKGCALLKKESAEHRRTFTTLWIHEVYRVFYDRLIADDDKNWVYEYVKTCVQNHFKDNIDYCLEALRDDSGVVTKEAVEDLAFVNCMDQDALESDKKYEQTSIDDFKALAQDILDEFNASHKDKIDVVLFKYAVKHLAKICRIVATPSGSGLLVGVGGSGRKSLCRLAANVMGCSFFMTEMTKAYGVNDWRDDMKSILKESGGRGRDTIFYFSETQVKEELFLQDIDSLLNSGEVPNIFAVDERQEILEMVRLAAQGGNRNLDVSALQAFAFFTGRCRQKLHVMLCFSPIGSSFRTRLRLYPALVNCCTIVWYEMWPEDALAMVAEKYVNTIPLASEVRVNCVDACKYFHSTAKIEADKFFIASGRKAYITTAAFLELIKSFAAIILQKQEDIMAAKMRYIGGLERLDFAASQVKEMKDELTKLQPKLSAAVSESLRIVAIIERESVKVEHATALVREDEKLANKQAEASQALKAECEADLALAIPILEEAIQALRTLKPQDITLVKSMKNPPDAVKLVMQAVCIMRGIPPDRVDDRATGRKINDYWGPSLKMMADINFLQALRDYDKDNIPLEIMTKIRKEILPNKIFNPAIVAKASSAAEGICKWIIAMDMYDVVAKEVAPKKAKLEIAEEKFARTMEVLNRKRAEVDALEEQLNKLNEKLTEANNHKKSLEDEVTLCKNKLMRAEKLIGGLGGEQSRWSAEANRLQANFDTLAGDILVSCALIAYLATFSIASRAECIDRWHKYVEGLKIPCSKEFNFIKTLGSDIKIQSWNIHGLPRDSFSTENAIIVDNSRRYCLMIDPQTQANKWIKNMEKNNDLIVTKFTDPDYTKALELALSAGRPLLLENILEELETPLDPILNKAFFRQGNATFISLGDNVIECNVNFRFYMTSKLRNPHYLPEVFNKVTIVNFALTSDGLEDQLLAIVVAKERPDLEEKRQNLIVEDAANRKALKDVEENILQTLSQSKGNILEDETAIQVLDSSKTLASEITKRQEMAKETQEKIDSFRQSYKPVATHSAALFYCITDLPNIDPMYQYSLSWFINLYITSIENANKAKELERRLFFLKDTFTYNLYSNVCRSLFEKDKLLFSCMLATTVLILQKKVTRAEFNFFITGGVGLDNPLKNPGEPWLTDKSWDEVCRVDSVPGFEGFKNSFVSNIGQWKAFYDLEEPQDREVPSSWRKVTMFQKCIIIRMIRPDKVIASVIQFVENSLDKRFITPPTFDISKSFTDSNCLTPLIFILSPGGDPMAALLNFAAKKNQSGEKFQSTSLGQGQGPIAAAMIREAQASGAWVCLQNCHVAVSWMSTLEKIWESFDLSNTHLGFRLWLTSYPSPNFPVGILQHGVKMTNEPPTGLRMNLLRSYLSEPVNQTEFFEGCPGKDRPFGKLLYSICFFHAVVQERRKFGPIGWNIPYGFDESDFQISVRQLQMFINEYDEIPYLAVGYLTGECNYGGRVTDDWDRRTLTTTLSNFVNPKVVDDPNYVFCPLGSIYGLPRKGEYKIYLKHIEALPAIPPPEVYGLHLNAGITRDLKNTNVLMESLIAVQGKMSHGEGESTEKLLIAIIGDILGKLPKPFDIEAASRKYPVAYAESMNTVLVQEMDRFNRLLKVIHSSLVELDKAVKGLVVMSTAVEAVMGALLVSKVPALWAKASYPSLKPLMPYINDFVERMQTLQNWEKNGKPVVFWLSGFYFTQAFLTGAMQDYARKYTVPIDELGFDFQVMKGQTESSRPADGVLCNRLYIDGARWDTGSATLAEQIPKVLHDMLPIIWFKPTKKKDIVEGKMYKCPLYRTSERRGVLSTTGHSTNFVLPLLLPTSKPASHWIMRGTALLSQLDH